MLIKSIRIKNYRLFPSDKYFDVSEVNIPDSVNQGSGLTVFVGENGTGKTSLLDAAVLPFLPHKAENFSVDDFNDPTSNTEIIVYADRDFEFDGTMPKAKYKGKGFLFKANIRSQGNKSYLSSVTVSDQQFIRADGETKPQDNSPDLRVNVNNPYKGNRFNENDYLYLDKNRTFHIRSGTYNKTRFDRLMEDLDFQYLDKIGKKPEDLTTPVFDKLKQYFEHKFLSDSLTKFKEISGHDISLDLIHNWLPFSGGGFFSSKTKNNLQVNLASLGSGYETIFSIIYSFYLARQSGKQLILFIDEPELHLHPKLQEEFVKFLLEISKESQVILTAHSPLLVKQLLGNEKVKACILRKKDDEVEVVKIEERVLPYVSADEINFIAFELPTAEYHNELYGHLHFINGAGKGIKDFDNDFFVGVHGEQKTYPWVGNQNEVSIHTFIRNQIHHPEDNDRVDATNLKDSIKKMREILLPKP